MALAVGAEQVDVSRMAKNKPSACETLTAQIKTGVVSGNQLDGFLSGGAVGSLPRGMAACQARIAGARCSAVAMAGS